VSQYYSIKVGNIHDEDYYGWLDFCKRLKKIGVLDHHAVAMELTWEAVGTFNQIFEAVRLDDPHPERYIPDGYKKGAKTCP